MALLRFATARDLYEAFETALDDIGVQPTDEPSLTFLQSLASAQVWDAAISFSAYLLPRREAVWWGCRSVRQMIHLTPHENDILALAEAWVREPEEDRRRAALTCGYQANSRLPATWIALAAGWSGGSIVMPKFGNVPSAPHQTPRAIRAGLTIAMAGIAAENYPTLLSACIHNAIELVGS